MTNSNIVYKFYSAGWGLDALYRERLKVSTDSDINDPFEFLPTGKGKEHRKRAKKIRNKMFETGGIISFSNSWSEPLLWSHYGDNHRGVALGFVLDKIDSYPVKYEDTRVALPSAEMDSDDFSFQEQLGTTKYKKWEYEGEVRIFPGHDASVNENGLYFRPFSKIGTLKKVILGANYKSNGNSKLTDRLRRQSVEILTARLAFENFSVTKQKYTKLQKEL